jgi:hypothetical protein
MTDTTEAPMRIIPGGLDDPRVIALLEMHLATARAETAPGSAHALDRRHGFVDCPPFGDYRPDPNSRFMMPDLRGAPPEAAAGGAEKD